MHRWDGFIVCKEDWEARHPQDFIKAKTDRISVPFSRPQRDDFSDDELGNRQINGHTINTIGIN